MTLHHILVRVAADTGRHAGHADIIRELIDGTVGRAKETPNMAPGDQACWQYHRDQVERAAKEAAKGSDGATERLLLLPWTEDYSGDFASVCADPEAMRFINGGRPLHDDLIQSII